MIDILLHILSVGIKDKLKDNIFADNLYSVLSNSREIPTYEQLQGYIYKSKKNEDFIEEVKYYNKDYRFKQIQLKGIKKFPGDNLYQISFVDKYESPCSSIFIGGNGVGKTTIFNCLEKVALGKLYSVPSINMPSYSESTFLSNIITPINFATIRLVTQGDYFENIGLKENTPIVAPAFFCSNTDVWFLMQNGITSSYIAEQLGLLKYQLLIDSLNKIKSHIELNYWEYLNLKKDYNYINGIITILKNISKSEDKVNALKKIFPFKTWNIENELNNRDLEKWDKKVSQITKLFPELKEKIAKEIWGISEDKYISKEQKQKSIREAIIKLKSTLINKFGVDNEFNILNDINESIEEVEKQQQNLFNEINNIEINQPIFKESTEMIKSVVSTYDYLLDNYHTIIKEIKDNSSDIFDSLLKDFYEGNVAKILLTITSQGTLSIEVIPMDPKTKKSLDSKNCQPQQFLNTFRFKLFCVALKVSLSLYTQRLYNINFPIVIDDVFDSSDFANKDKITEFITHILDVHKKICNTNNDINKQLQLVFFTSDDVIAESVYKAIKNRLYYSVKISRIYNYLDLSENDKKKNGEIESISIEDVIEMSDNIHKYDY